MLLNCLVCEDPPSADRFSMTNPVDITVQFLATQTIEYSCNGDLLPANSIIRTCIDKDNEASMAVWWPNEPIPQCGKYILLLLKSFSQILQ